MLGIVFFKEGSHESSGRAQTGFQESVFLGVTSLFFLGKRGNNPYKILTEHISTFSTKNHYAKYYGDVTLCNMHVH